MTKATKAEKKATAVKSAAAWMAAEVKREGCLYQLDAADRLLKKWSTCVYDNDSGGLSIDKDVLAEFRRLTEKTVVWDRSEKCWRRRESGDGRGRLAEGT